MSGLELLCRQFEIKIFCCILFSLSLLKFLVFERTLINYSFPLPSAFLATAWLRRSVWFEFQFSFRKVRLDVFLQFLLKRASFKLSRSHVGSISSPFIRTRRAPMGKRKHNFTPATMCEKSGCIVLVVQIYLCVPSVGFTFAPSSKPTNPVTANAL